MLFQLSFESFGGLVSNVAFPIAAFYLMYRMVNNEIQELNHRIRELNTSIRDLKATIQADVLTRADNSLKYNVDDIEKWLEENTEGNNE